MNGSPAPEVLFRLEGVSLVSDGSPVLIGVDLELPAAGLTVLVGESGAGKSSLLRCLNMLDVPTSGEISFRGRRLSTMDPLVHRRSCAMVFQRPVVFAGTVLDNLHVADPDLSVDQARLSLARVGLREDLIEREADKLSGGEAQRLVTARALVTSPAVLLADEPTSALDRTATAEVESLLRTLVDDGLPVILVTHDLAQVRRIADRVVVMGSGRMLGTGAIGDPDLDSLLCGLGDSGSRG